MNSTKESITHKGHAFWDSIDKKQNMLDGTNKEINRMKAMLLACDIPDAVMKDESYTK